MNDSAIHDLNQQAARRIENELLGDPDSPYRRKWIGIANGQVVVAAETFDEAQQRLSAAEPDVSRTLLMEGLGEGDEGMLATYGEWLCPERGRGCPLAPGKVAARSPEPEEGIPMTPLSGIALVNSQLADKINNEALRDPSSLYAGKIVGIANGIAVVVADNLDEAMDRLLAIEPDPTKCYCFEAGVDYDEVQDVGGMI